MDTVVQWALALRGSIGLKIVFLLLLCWVLLYFVCFVFGGIGLYQIGRRQSNGSALFAWLPVVQIYYEIRLARMERNARQAELLLWWWLVFGSAGLVCALWGAVGYLNAYASIAIRLLSALAVLFLLAAFAFYLWIRILEFCALKRLFKKYRGYWAISLIGTIFGLPLQRLFLFVIRKRIK
ncbi:MAG: hypothetical protein DBX52_02845 [Clostridiales bacterium]|nr:MAG: hypothetical protein DBX52_02845 [Clostridiales bacterium]